MGDNYIGQHGIEIEKSWILHAPPLSSYLYSHQKDSPSSSEREYPVWGSLECINHPLSSMQKKGEKSKCSEEKIHLHSCSVNQIFT